MTIVFTRFTREHYGFISRFTSPLRFMSLSGGTPNPAFYFRRSLEFLLKQVLQAISCIFILLSIRLLYSTCGVYPRLDLLLLLCQIFICVAYAC